MRSERKNTIGDIVQAIQDSPGISTSELCELFAAHRKTMQSHLFRAAKFGLVQNVSPREVEAVWHPVDPKDADTAGETPVQRIVPASETAPPQAGPRSVWELAR